MYTVDLYLRVRLACHVDGLSQREAASRFGIARETVRKMLRHSEPPGYRRRQPPKRPKLAVPPIYSIYRRNLGILHHPRIPFPACIRSSKSSRTARRSTQKSLPCDQVAVRKRPRPSLRKADRVFWVILSCLWPGWRHALVIVRPETVIGWHRKGFRLFWTWKSRRGVSITDVAGNTRSLPSHLFHPSQKPASPPDTLSGMHKIIEIFADRAALKS